jgi:Mg2+ and Co2+ transporter CorA
MIDLFKGVELALSEYRHKEAQKRAFFTGIIEPLFNDLNVAVNNYEKLWIAVKAQAEKVAKSRTIDASTEGEMRNDLESLRQDMYGFRRAVAGIAHGLTQLAEVENQDFGRLILELFVFKVEDDEYKSDFGRLVERLEALSSISYQATLRDALPEINAAQHHVRRTWQKLVDHYGKLRIRSLT